MSGFSPKGDMGTRRRRCLAFSPKDDMGTSQYAADLQLDDEDDADGSFLRAVGRVHAPFLSASGAKSIKCFLMQRFLKGCE